MKYGLFRGVGLCLKTVCGILWNRNFIQMPEQAVLHMDMVDR